MTAGAQFGRSLSLQLFDTPGPLFGGTATPIELSEFRVRFQISANDFESPNTALIRIYNLGPEISKLILAEYRRVVLSAGYGENLGTIFQGTVKSFVRGKERNTDSFLEIRAADGDIAYNFGMVNESLPDGHNLLDVWNVTAKGLQKAAASIGDQVTLDPYAAEIIAQFPGGINPSPKGRVMFGLARGHLRDLANTIGARWSIQHGQLILVPNTGYLPGDPIKINSTSGLVGIPEATESGINVTTLLNPAFRVGYPVLMNEGDITRTDIKAQFFPGYKDFNFVATVDQSTEGLYRVIVVDHAGDSRGPDWYSNLVCLKLDPSAAPNAAVVGSY